MRETEEKQKAPGKIVILITRLIHTLILELGLVIMVCDSFFRLDKLITSDGTKQISKTNKKKWGTKDLHEDVKNDEL